MNTDTLIISKDLIEPAFNWWQIIIQTLILGVILEIIRRYFLKELEFLKNEFTIIHTTFSKNYSVISKYYSNFYKLYRECQNVVNYDIIDLPNNDFILTGDKFLNNLDLYLDKLKKIEPAIRLILPQKIIKIHDNAYTAFNDFSDLIRKSKQSRTLPRKDLIDKFNYIDTIKNNFEKELRKYLRTEKLFSK